MYADNMLIYLSDLQQSLPNVLEIIEDFATLSGYKINYSKSILLVLNTDLKKDLQTGGAKCGIFGYRDQSLYPDNSEK